MFPHAALPLPHVALQVPRLPQLMSLHALLPWQSAVHVPSPQLSLPQTCAPLPPEQVSLHVPVVLHVMLPHAALPVQVASHVPVVQLMLPHACWPVQVTLQSFVPHWMPRHALFELQSMVHDAALLHVSMPHEPGDGQLMLQCQPVGHVRLPLPVPVIVHVDVAKSQVPPQIAGHTAASIGLTGASASGFAPITQ